MKILTVCEVSSGYYIPESWIVVGYYGGHPFISIRLPLFKLGWHYFVENDSHRHGWYTPQIMLRKEYEGLIIRWRMAFHSDLFGEFEERENSLRKLPQWSK